MKRTVDETLPGTKDFTLPWMGPIRVEWYGAYCSQGHEMRSIKERTLAITLGDNRFELTAGVKPANPWRRPICGKCLFG